ncbi:MAG: DNA-formamidopyrimidine glycosylase family protein [Myxococcota bacterium]|nr:DNA-formamidopyrimidine glycosylase family protein [Myxococcota bacterium]
MPELPEVEFIKRRLSRWTVGRSIQTVEVPDPKALQSDSGTLAGRSFQTWERKGKYLVGLMDDGRGLLSHLGMTGKWVADPKPDRPHQRLRLHFGDDEGPLTVALIDPRRLGLNWLLDATALSPHPRLVRLGPDAMSDTLTPEELSLRVGSDHRPLKRRLMDQAVVAGLGNIMVSEMCWRARVHPHCPCAQVDEASWLRLHQAVRDHVLEVLEKEQGEEILYVSGGGGASDFLCYGRAGEPCGRCGTTLASDKLDGRTSTWCPACQPLET